MPTATFRVHGSLNDFIAMARRGRPIAHEFEDSPGIKDVLQALGLPHPEVDLIVVNGRSRSASTTGSGRQISSMSSAWRGGRRPRAPPAWYPRRPIRRDSCSTGTWAGWPAT